MNREDKELDQLFKDASQQKTFEFKDEFWEEFEKMLPEKKGKKKIGVFWWLNSGLLVIAIIGGVIFFSSKDTSIHLAKNDLKDELTISNGSNNLNQIDVIPSNNENNLSGLTTKKNNNSSDKSITYSVEQNANNSNKIYKKESAFQEEIKSINVDDIVTKQSSINILKGTESLINPANLIEKSTIDELSNIQEDIGLLDKRQIDLCLYPSFIKNGIYASKTKKWRSYFDGFYSINQSPIINSTNGSNFSNGFGLGFGAIRSKSNWQLTGGLNLVAQQYSNLTINDSVKVYGFGVKNYQSEISYRSLYTIELPLYAGYSIKNHTIQFGIVPSYLMLTKLDYVVLLNDQIQTESSAYNYKKGLTSFMLKPSLKYSFKIAPTWQIGAVIQIHAISPISKNIFTGIQNNHPLNGQLFIRKTIY